MNPTQRVTDEVLSSVCGIIEKTEGIGKSEEAFGEVLRKCALDLRDARAEVERLRAVKDAAREMLLAYEASVRLCEGEHAPHDPAPLLAAITKHLCTKQVLWRAIEAAEAAAKGEGP